MRKNNKAVLPWLLMAVLPQETALARQNSNRPQPEADSSLTSHFTVRDSIELTKIVPFKNAWEPNPPSGSALFSPDQGSFVIHTTRGDIQRNVNVEELRLFRTADVTRVLATKDSRAAIESKAVATVDVDTPWGSISNVRWLDSRRIGFIAQGDGGVTQAFVVDSVTGLRTQLTHSPRDVRAFDVRGDIVLYLALAPPDDSDSINVEGKTVEELISPNDYLERRVFPRLILTKESIHTGVPIPLNAPVTRLYEVFHSIWLSPSGNYAITLAPSINAPEHWGDYRIPNSRLFGYTPEHRRSDPVSPDLQFRTRYQLVDLRQNTTRPLLDAPTGYVINAGHSMHSAIWSKDEKSVVVTNTLLPLEGSSESTDPRRTTPAVAEIHLETGGASPVMWEPTDGTGGVFDRIEAVTRDSKSNLIWISVSRRGTASATSETSSSQASSHSAQLITSHYQKRGARWGKLDATQTVGDDLRILLRQDLNVRPKLFATRTECRCLIEIFDPSPTADRFVLSKAQKFEWQDANQVKWRGALLVPPRLEKAAMLPLVVQTHGFQPDEFLIDGAFGATTAFAAQAFASSGIAVLQVEDNPLAESGDTREGASFTNGVRAAIESLTSIGLVDASRIGIIGWSRTSFHTLHYLSGNPNMFAAATLADGMQPGYVSYIFNVNSNRDLVGQLDDLTGGPPVVGRMDEWMNRNPLYSIPGSETPVRLEAMGTYSLIRMWETYATLRYSNRPVDYVYFPHGEHVLTKPGERLSSQQGNVDWFRFWLQAYEDPAPDKTAQYERWRRLKLMTSKTSAKGSGIEQSSLLRNGVTH